MQKKLQQQDAEKQAILDDLMQKMKEYNEKQAEINKITAANKKKVIGNNNFKN